MPSTDLISNLRAQLSYAEEQRSKYKIILEEISIQLEKTKKLDEQMQILRSDYNVMESNADSAMGKISTTYEDKEEINRCAMEDLYNDLKSSIAEVNSKLTVVQSQYGYWCNEITKIQQWIKEEEERIEREKERQRQAILNRARELIDERF